MLMSAYSLTRASQPHIFVLAGPPFFGGGCKSLTLDSGLDRGLDQELDHGLKHRPKHGPKLIMKMATAYREMVSPTQKVRNSVKPVN